jgi:hypothetical protein
MQSTFVPGRLITDNALIAFQCLHAIKNGGNGCKKLCSYKLDLTRSYDRVDWRFLEGSLKWLCFHSTFDSVGYGVCIHCQLYGPFQQCSVGVLQTIVRITPR